MKSVLISFLIAATFFAAGAFSRHSTSIERGRERALRPTLIGYAVAGAGGVPLPFIIADFWKVTDPEQVPYLYVLLIGFSIAFIWAVWFFLIREVYWNDEGVGVRRTTSSRLIGWDEIKDFQTSATDFLLISQDRKIRYSGLHGGHQQLTDEIARRFPQFAGRVGK